MKATCYILYSQILDKFYIGATQDDVNLRILKHNNKNYGSHRYTAITNDWELFLSLDVKTYDHAIRIERKIKAMKSKTYIKNLKKYQDMRDKLIINTSS